MIERIEILASVIDMSSVANRLPLRNNKFCIWKKNINADRKEMQWKECAKISSWKSNEKKGPYLLLKKKSTGNLKGKFKEHNRKSHMITKTESKAREQFFCFFFPEMKIKWCSTIQYCLTASGRVCFYQSNWKNDQ